MFIVSLWIIEQRDEKALKKAEIEATVTKELFKQVEKSYRVFNDYENNEIPEEVKELGISSLEASVKMYGSTMASLNLNLSNNNRVGRVIDAAYGALYALNNEKLTEKEFDIAKSHIDELKEVVEMTDENFNEIETMIENYWWRSS